MKIDYISDLHLDFICNKSSSNNDKLLRSFAKLSDYLNIKKSSVGEILLIAGDLGHYHYQNTEFLKYLKTFYNHICVVPGNHDLYLISKQQAKQFKYNSNNRITEMKEFCEDTNGLHFLDGDVVEINGVTIGGVGMFWDDSYFQLLKGYKPTNFELLKLYTTEMNDSNYINTSNSYKQKQFNPIDYFNEQHQKLQNIQSADIMMSHYVPVIPPNMNEKYVNEITNTFYYFDGSKNIDRINPKYWVFGHVHNKYDFVKNSTHFISNPLGYPGENYYVSIESFTL